LIYSHHQTNSPTGAQYEGNIANAQRISDEEWEPIAAQIANLQDEKRGTEGLAQMMKMVIGM